MDYLNNLIFEEDGEIIKWKVLEIDANMVLVEFELKRNLEPNDLKTIKLPDPIRIGFSPKVVILSGKGPVWFYAFITHKYHIVRVLAIFDPRLDGAVVVESHDVNYKPGDVVRRELFYD